MCESKRYFSKAGKSTLTLSRFLGPFSLPNLKNLLPVFQAEARHLSTEFVKAIGQEKSRVLEGHFSPDAASKKDCSNP